MRFRLHAVVLAAATAIGPVQTQGQGGPTGLDAGARVRIQLPGDAGTWRYGWVVSAGTDSLLIRGADGLTAVPRGEITRLETPWRSKRGALAGAALGAGLSLVLASGYAEAGSSDLAGVAVLGGLIGAGAGSGRRTRVAAGVGAAIGGALGAIVFGATGTACEQGGNTYCNAMSGGIMVGIVGLTIGTGVGMLLPNWVRVPVDRLEVGAARGGIRLAWRIG